MGKINSLKKSNTCTCECTCNEDDYSYEEILRDAIVSELVHKQTVGNAFLDFAKEYKKGINEMIDALKKARLTQEE